jgi:dihydrofolate synthase/folylpolyglutamate synthase
MQSLLYKTDYSELKIKSFDLGGTEINYKGKEVKIPLLGAYQPRNTATVLEAVSILRQGGLSISDEAIKVGLAKAKWPARFEIICRDPLVIFDGAHNPEGISAATKSIKEYFPGKRVITLTGVLRDKDYFAVAKDISAVSSEAFTITPTNPRALSAEEYAKVLSGTGCHATPCGSIAEALTLGIAAAERQNTALCCLGSLYTYSEVMNTIEKSDA